MPGYQRVEEKDFRQRHLGGEDGVAETARRLAVGGEGHQIIEPDHHRAAVMPLDHLMLAEIVDAAIKGDVATSAGVMLLQRPLGELVEEIELGVDGVVVKAARHLLADISHPRLVEQGIQRLFMESGEEAEAALDPALEHSPFGGVAVVAPAAQEAIIAGAVAARPLFLVFRLLLGVEPEHRLHVGLEGQGGVVGAIGIVQHAKQAAVGRPHPGEMQRHRLVVEGDRTQPAGGHPKEVGAVTGLIGPTPVGGTEIGTQGVHDDARKRRPQRAKRKLYRKGLMYGKRCVRSL